MQLQDSLSEISMSIEKVNVMVSYIFAYLSDKPEALRYYQKENFTRSSIALDYVNQALKQMQQLERKIENERK